MQGERFERSTSDSSPVPCGILAGIGALGYPTCEGRAATPLSYPRSIDLSAADDSTAVVRHLQMPILFSSPSRASRDRKQPLRLYPFWLLFFGISAENPSILHVFAPSSISGRVIHNVIHFSRYPESVPIFGVIFDDLWPISGLKPAFLRQISRH